MATSALSLLKKSKYSHLDDNVEMESLITGTNLKKTSSQRSSRPNFLGASNQNSFSNELSLYKDNYITIYPTMIVLHSYYFPFGKPKTILISDIERINSPEELNIPWWDQMNWGRGYNKIWWARDEKRGLPKCNKTLIFTERGESLLKACSVKDFDYACSIISERMRLS